MSDEERRNKNWALFAVLLGLALLLFATTFIRLAYTGNPS